MSELRGKSYLACAAVVVAAYNLGKLQGAREMRDAVADGFLRGSPSGGRGKSHPAGESSP